MRVKIFIILALLSMLILTFAGFLEVKASNRTSSSMADKGSVLDTVTTTSQKNPSAILAEPESHYPERCTRCHDFGDTCSVCHSRLTPRDHIVFECAACHSTEDWLTTSADHSREEFIQCESCHEETRPEDHYTSTCSQCHTPGGWSDPNLAHLEDTTRDCLHCHLDDSPKDHFML